MRFALLAPLTALLISSALVTATARADVGPRAPCEAGTHHVYLRGHHCVPDGSHLEQDADGRMQIVKGSGVPTAVTPPKPPAPAVVDPPKPPAPAVVDPPKPPPSATFATPPAADGPPPSPPGPSPEAPLQRGCACDLGESPSGLTGGAFGLAALLFTISRRRSHAARGRSSS